MDELTIVFTLPYYEPTDSKSLKFILFMLKNGFYENLQISLKARHFITECIIDNDNISSNNAKFTIVTFKFKLT